MDPISSFAYQQAFATASENSDVPGFQHIAGDAAAEASAAWIDGITDGLRANSKRPKRIEVAAALMPIIQKSGHFNPGFYKDIPCEIGEDNYGNKRIYVEM